MRSASGCLARLLLVTLAAAPAGRADDEVACGPRALYLLTSLETGRAMLVPEASGPGPHSLLQLREVASRAGLRLRGVRLDQALRTLRTPSLVHLETTAHGHFVVIRPVGRSGRLVQVLDPNRDPYILDRDKLPQLPGWTGLALVPDHPNRTLLTAGAALAVAGLLGLAVPRLRERPGRPTTPASLNPKPNCFSQIR